MTPSIEDFEKRFCITGNFPSQPSPTSYLVTRGTLPDTTLRSTYTEKSKCLIRGTDSKPLGRVCFANPQSQRIRGQTTPAASRARFCPPATQPLLSKLDIGQDLRETVDNPSPAPTFLTRAWKVLISSLPSFLLRFALPKTLNKGCCAAGRSDCYYTYPTSITYLSPSVRPSNKKT